MNAGRPFRFIAVTLGGWVGLRTLVLIVPEPEAATAAARVASVARPAALSPTTVSAVPTLLLAPIPPSLPAAVQQAARSGQPLAAAEHRIAGGSSSVVASADAEPVALADAPPAQDGAGMLPLPVKSPDAPRPGRWSASAWMIVRGGSRGDPLSASQLGGSQAGVRVALALGESRRVALVGRVAAPLNGTGREASIGAEWRPTALPVRLFVEQRVALDGGKGGPGIGAVGGLYREIGALRIEGYAQAGLVRRARTEPYADGAARIAAPVAAVGPARFDLGVAAWGGAQRGAARVDVGPTIGARLPIGRHALRVAAEWRERVAGEARPASGPALSIGADF